MKQTCERCGKPIQEGQAAVRRGCGRYCSKACCWPLLLLPEEERFWAQVNVGQPDECWEWKGSRQSPNSYGRFHLGVGKNYQYAHIMAWELTNQACMLPGYVVRHAVCDNRPCCNPAHLKPGTHQDNIQDRVDHGRTASGNRNGSRAHPERRPRGAKHSLRMKEVAARGDAHVCAKLRTWQIPYVKKLREAGFSYYTIGKAYGVSEYPIRAIFNGISWKHAEQGGGNG